MAERSRRFMAVPEFFLAREQIRTHRVGFHRNFNGTDTPEDVWDKPGNDASSRFPLFQPAEVIKVQSDDAGDDGSTIEILGLGDNAVFQAEDIPITPFAGGDIFTSNKFRAPIIQIQLKGESGDRSGAVGNITASSANVGTVGVILLGRVRSQNSIREVPRDEMYIVKGVDVSSVTEGGGGNKVAYINFQIMSAHPDERVHFLHTWGFTEQIARGNIRETFNGTQSTLPNGESSYLFARASGSEASTIITGFFSVGVVVNKKLTVFGQIASITGRAVNIVSHKVFKTPKKEYIVDPRDRG